MSNDLIYPTSPRGITAEMWFQRLVKSTSLIHETKENHQDFNEIIKNH